MQQRKLGSVKNKVTATELVVERQNCDFDQSELKGLLYADEETKKICDKARHDIENDPKLMLTHKYYEWTVQEKQEMWMKKLNHLWFNHDRKFYFQEGSRINGSWVWHHHGQPMIGMHLTMFTQSVEQFSDDEQRKKWVPMTKEQDILGCYAQTELGHGSNVAGLETTATFDKETDEFVIDMPTITATKWWPGEMGRYANHALVFARLIIVDDGAKNDYGVAPFIVQIRDRDTHKHLPGVKSGDMGPKMGFIGKDNGWLTLHNVRVPRNQMLQRFLKVDRDGSVSVQGDLKLLYSTMLKTRVHIISGCPHFLLTPLLIGVRYSLCRRQFKNISGRKEETQLLDYQTQQMKLFPIVAKFFGALFAAQHVYSQVEIFLEGVKKMDFRKLDLCHHYTAGMKSLFTQDAFDGILQIRQSLGGAGYSAWSGIPRIIEDCSPFVTFEGDNTVMAQQAFNFLYKQAKKAKSGKDRTKVDFVFAYLGQLDEIGSMRCQATNADDFLDIDLIDECLRVSLSHKLKKVMKQMHGSSASKKDKINSLFALEIVDVSQDHMRYVTFQLFKAKLNYGVLKCPQNQANLGNLCKLYGLFNLYQDCTACFESGYFQNGQQSQYILEAIKKLNLQIRPQILNILESFAVPDSFIQSAIGNSYGDIYEQHLEWAKDSRLNHTKAGDAIPDGYMEHIMPILKAKM